MVKVSTLIYRVDDFSAHSSLSVNPVILNQDLGDQFLNELLSPLVFDPGEELVKTIFKKI
jgi:hypothetical protein